MDPLEELKEARGSYKGPRWIAPPPGGVPKYNGITIIYWVYVVSGVALILCGVVGVVFGWTLPGERYAEYAGNPNLAALLAITKPTTKDSVFSALAWGLPLIVSGLVVYGLGEVFLAIRDIARNSWRR